MQAALREGLVLANTSGPQRVSQSRTDNQQAFEEEINLVQAHGALSRPCNGDQPPSLDASTNLCQGFPLTAAEGGQSCLAQPVVPEVGVSYQTVEADLGRTTGTSHPSVPASEGDPQRVPTIEGGLFLSTSGMDSALPDIENVSILALGMGCSSANEHEKFALVSCRNASGSGHDEVLADTVNLEASCVLFTDSSPHTGLGDNPRPSDVENLTGRPGRLTDSVEGKQRVCQDNVDVCMELRCEEGSDAAVLAGLGSICPLLQDEDVNIDDKFVNGIGVKHESTNLDATAPGFSREDGQGEGPGGARLTSSNLAEPLGNDAMSPGGDRCCHVSNAAGLPAEFMIEASYTQFTREGLGQESPESALKETGTPLPLGVASQGIMVDNVSSTVNSSNSHLLRPKVATGVAVTVPDASIQGYGATSVEASSAVHVSASPCFKDQLGEDSSLRVSAKIRKRMRGRSGTNVQWYKVGRVWRVF